MENKFKPGDVVQLKSSLNKRFTIEKINADGTYFCTWLDDRSNLKKGDLAEIVIQLWINPAGRYSIG